MLVRLAEALGIRDLAELTGEPAAAMGLLRRGQHPAVPSIRDAVLRYRITRPAQAPYPLVALRARIEGAWRLWHTSANRRDEVGALLPDLLIDCQDTAAVLDGDDGREAHRDPGRRLPPDAARARQRGRAATAVDRRRPRHGRGPDRRRPADHRWRRLDCRDHATRRRTDRRCVQPGHRRRRGPRADPRRRPTRGPDRCGVPSSCTRRSLWPWAGRDGDAWAAWDRAHGAARALPKDYHHPWTAFGLGNVELHGISLTVDLWKSREALRRAEHIDPAILPSRERRGGSSSRWLGAITPTATGSRPAGCCCVPATKERTR